MESATPRIIDLNAESAKHTLFRGRTPTTSLTDHKGTVTQLGQYRDGILLLSKSAGTGHWETHPEDELLYVLDGAIAVDILAQDRVQTVAAGAGMIAVVPPGAWRRVRSVDGTTVMSATIPGDHIDLDVADPRAVAGGPASGAARIETDVANAVVDLNGLDGRGSHRQRRSTGPVPRRCNVWDQVIGNGSLGVASDRR
jgi:quercetin dioxygenase-like cupin family protein